MLVTDVVWKGYRRDLYTIGAATFSESTSLHHMEVPGNKRWIVIGGVANITQNATLNVYAYNASDQMLLRIVAVSATTGVFPWPQTFSSTTNWAGLGFPIVLESGEYLAFAFGAAQDAAAYVNAMVLEIDL